MLNPTYGMLTLQALPSSLLRLCLHEKEALTSPANSRHLRRRLIAVSQAIHEAADVLPTLGQMSPDQQADFLVKAARSLAGEIRVLDAVLMALVTEAHEIGTHDYGRPEWFPGAAHD